MNIRLEPNAENAPTRKMIIKENILNIRKIKLAVIIVLPAPNK